MSPDEERFRGLIDAFVADSGFDPPFFLIITGQNESISVRYYSASGAVEEVCSRVVEPGFTPPLVLSVISPAGAGRSALVTVEAPARVLQ